MRTPFYRTNQEKSPSLQGTTPETGVPLPPYAEGFDFPRYSTDDVREMSLLKMVPDLADQVVTGVGYGEDPQTTFDAVMNAIEAFGEVPRKVWQQLPRGLQEVIDY